MEKIAFDLRSKRIIRFNHMTWISISRERTKRDRDLKEEVRGRRTKVELVLWKAETKEKEKAVGKRWTNCKRNSWKVLKRGNDYKESHWFWVTIWQEKRYWHP